jgi:hypothetical protein
LNTIIETLSAILDESERIVLPPGPNAVSMVKNKNDRVELEMKLMKYRSLARRVVHAETEQRISLVVLELERKLREIDE